MTVLLVVLGLLAGLVLMIVKALAIDQARGQIQRRIEANLEATIAGLSADLQAEWAEEWRAELAAIITMPLTALQFARDLRRSTRDLVVDPALAAAVTANQAPQRTTSRSARWRRRSSTWHFRTSRRRLLKVPNPDRRYPVIRWGLRLGEIGLRMCERLFRFVGLVVGPTIGRVLDIVGTLLRNVMHGLAAVVAYLGALFGLALLTVSAHVKR